MVLSFRLPRFLRADRVVHPYGGTSWTPSPTKANFMKKSPRSRSCGVILRIRYWMEMELLLGSCFFAFLGTETVRMPSSNLAETSSGSTASPT